MEASPIGTVATPQLIVKSGTLGKLLFEKWKPEVLGRNPGTLTVDILILLGAEPRTRCDAGASAVWC